jgi:hypothetical protein
MQKIEFPKQEEFWDAIDTQGFFWSHMQPDFDTLLAAPADFVETMTGICPSRVSAFHVIPRPGGQTYITSDMDCRFHIDTSLACPAPLHFLFCVEQIAEGGETMLLDGWKLLDEAQNNEPAFFDALFDVPRRMRFAPKAAFGPTVSLRQNRLVLMQPPFPGADLVGHRVQEWVDTQEPVRFKMWPGDFYVLNNQRCFHNRSPFKGHRHMIRLLCWFPEPLYAPKPYLDKAARSFDRIKEILKDYPEPVLQRFGLTEVAAHYSDQDASDEVMQAALDDLISRLNISVAQPA